jgi:hypothetical protein
MKNRVNNTHILNKFDYNILKSEQRSIIQQKTEEIKERLKRSAQDIWEIGQKLSEVRSQLAYGHFDKWLKAEFGWSRRTAYNFIKVYEAFPERATVAQVNIAASALYQLSSPSTSKEVRAKFIKKAQDGRKVTRTDIREALKQEQSSSINAITTKQEQDLDQRSEITPSFYKSASPDPSVRLDREAPGVYDGCGGVISDFKQQIISVVPRAKSTIQSLVQEQHTREFVENSTDIFSVKPELGSQGWYSLGKQHFLFYGDTASPQFYEIISQANLAIAITSIDWDHDWLIDKVENLLVLKESFLEKESISTVISLFSDQGDTVLFPWLPDENMINSAHQLDRIVIAGDPNLDRCHKAIAKSNLIAKPILISQEL